MNHFLAQCGEWFKQHARAIRYAQWFVVLFYALLILIPVVVQLPDDSARIWNNITVFAQFIFWGIWWPFVLISMVLFGRIWCGILCPEGTLTEFASQKGLQKKIPKWIRWKGWPFVAFAATTIYGQMISVYQYPQATLLILGGSTVLAIIIGFLYGRDNRVWCRYLCPVNGVFALLAKLAPIHYRTDRTLRQASRELKIVTNAVNCPTLLPVHHLQSASLCHMCGRCSGLPNANALQARGMNAEILSGKEVDVWQSLLILYGLFGIAFGAFYWTMSPLFIRLKQKIAEQLINADIFWPLSTEIPWWIFTHYPAQNDLFSWLDGALIIAFILGMGLIVGSLIGSLLSISTRILGKWHKQRFHHLVQAFIPLAGCGIFLGLSLLTITLLKIEGIPVYWASAVRWTLLLAAALWTSYLTWQVLGRHTEQIGLQFTAMLPAALAILLGSFCWSLVI